MFNSYAIGFVCVAAAFVAGVDYVVQAKANDSSPGEYAVSDYIGSYSKRVAATVAAIDKARRQSELARAHLPETIPGWQRREWERDTSRDAEITAGMTFLEQRDFTESLTAARMAAKYEVFEYGRGEETIRLSARFEPAPGDGVRRERVESFVAPGVHFDTAQLSGYDIVEGVMFFRMADPKTGLGADPNGPLMLQGFVGDGVAIGAYAERPVAADLPGLLAAIDYDSLNAMLDEPLAAIGSRAIELSEAEKRALLDEAVAAYMASQGGRPAAAEPVAARDKPNGGQALAQKGAAQGGSAGQDSAAGNKAKRLQLSGGRSCLGSSGGRLCD